ncbi:hypothetical protein ACFWXO_05270 [Kitasatospora sp. NPDC059088]|uniref:hypothetical protein n=1 Tax=Kitasatospora sp. NPDC059088 TaxID=3346722 RepID=UPI0036756A61
MTNHLITDSSGSGLTTALAELATHRQALPVAHLEATSYVAAGAAYLTRDGDGPAHLVEAAKEETKRLAEQAAAEQKNNACSDLADDKTQVRRSAAEYGLPLLQNADQDSLPEPAESL